MSSPNRAVLSAVLGGLLNVQAYAGQLEKTLFLEATLFTESPAYPEQSRNDASIAFEVEYYTELGDSGYELTVTPFARYDEADSERTHADLREAVVYREVGDWEWRVGISKVFWGVNESRHLVDIVNQTDAVEGVDGEDKLGQPMIRATVVKDWGELDLFVLPYFRERTYPGAGGRPRLPLVVDTDRAVYESSREQRHVDAALRWGQTFGDWDVGVSYFTGTSRDPRLVAEQTQEGPVLVPHYDLIRQVGLDVQAIVEGWIWKLEAISRRGGIKDYEALSAGFEYTLVGLFDSASDLGLLMEYDYDSRGDEADTIFQDDLFLGARWALNDEASSELLMGALVDLGDGSQSWRAEGSRRLSDGWTIGLEAQLLTHVDQNNLVYAFNADDFIRLELKRYF